MSKSTISTFELFEMFPDADSARAYFEARRWPGGTATLTYAAIAYLLLTFLAVAAVAIGAALT